MANVPRRPCHTEGWRHERQPLPRRARGDRHPGGGAGRRRRRRHRHLPARLRDRPRPSRPAGPRQLDRRRRHGPRDGRGEPGRAAPRRRPAAAPRWSCACTTAPRRSSRRTAPTTVRRAIAAGEHLSTLAFSESGSRSHFWAPLSTATLDGDEVVLDASKSWVDLGRRGRLVRVDEPARPPGRDGRHAVARARRHRGPEGRPRRSTASGCAATPRARSWPRGPACRSRRGSAPTAPASTWPSRTVLPMFQVLNASCSLGLTDAAIGQRRSPTPPRPASSTSTRRSPTSPSRASTSPA